jgi:hypothetical protein
MKGVELPINTMVIVVIAVIILLALIAMYFSGFGPFSKTVGLEGVRGDACRRLVQENGCRVTTNTIEIDNFDANRNNAMNPGNTALGANFWTTTTCPGTPVTVPEDNLAALCRCYYGLDSESACRGLCGCAGGVSGGGGGTSGASSPSGCPGGITPCADPTTDCPPGSGCAHCVISATYPDGECKP